MKYCAAEGARRGTPTWTKRSKVASECFSLNVRSPPFVTVARRWEGFTLTVHVRPLLSYAVPGPNDRFRERAASVSLAAGFVIYQRISRSPAVVSAVSASTNHCGLRPRPDQVTPESSGWRYFGATVVCLGLLSVPTSSASE